jgi:hypothetical protein
LRYVALVSALLLGCMNTETVPPGARGALMQTTNGDTLRMPTATGGAVEFGPNATLHLDGEEVSASEVYWNHDGLYRKNGDFIASWDSLRVIRVEQIDGAATVAVTAAAAAVVVVAAAVLAGAGKGTGSSGSGGHGGGGHSGGSSPHSSGGGGHVRSAPNPADDPADPWLANAACRVAEAVASGSPDPSVSGGGTPSDANDEPDVDPAIPLFSRAARRRAQVRVLARLEGALCWPGAGVNGDCTVGGARGGVRLYDLFELSAGVRTETSNGITKPLASVGMMIHGESPTLHWLAIALGGTVAFDGDRAHIIPTFAIRLRPVRGLWFGLVPLQPVYSTETGGWKMASGVEVTGEF